MKNKSATIKEKKPETDSDYVTLRLLIPVTMYVTHTVSGNQYVFYGAGTEVKVLRVDAENLLQRRTPPGCCGTGGEGTPYFELVV